MNLSEPADLRRFLNKFGIGADKSLGQHFLCSEPIVQAIVEAVQDIAGILEIGPGPGILTSRLAEWDRKLIAIELDSKMLPALRESAPYAEIVSADALKSDFRALLETLPEPRAIVGNLPYYITGALINQIADARDYLNCSVLMIQKEVADRLAAAPGNADRGSISVYLQAKFDISVIAQVPPEAFLPPPKVRSTVLKFVPKLIDFDHEEELFRFVKIGFSQPRKTLANNLSNGLKLEKLTISHALEKRELRPDIRPHMLTQEDWIEIHASMP